MTDRPLLALPLLLALHGCAGPEPERAKRPGARPAPAPAAPARPRVTGGGARAGVASPPSRDAADDARIRDALRSAERTSATDALDWETDPDLAFARARSERKPMFVMLPQAELGRDEPDPRIRALASDPRVVKAARGFVCLEWLMNWRTTQSSQEAAARLLRSKEPTYDSIFGFYTLAAGGERVLDERRVPGQGFALPTAGTLVAMLEAARRGAAARDPRPDAPPARRADARAAQVGQRYRFEHENGTSIRWTRWAVTSLADGAVGYDYLEALWHTPQARSWRAEPAPSDGVGRETLVVSGLAFDCIITASNGFRTWTAVHDGRTVLPGALKCVAPDGAVRFALVEVEAP